MRSPQVVHLLSRGPSGLRHVCWAARRGSPPDCVIATELVESNSVGLATRDSRLSCCLSPGPSGLPRSGKSGKRNRWFTTFETTGTLSGEQRPIDLLEVIE